MVSLASKILLFFPLVILACSGPSKVSSKKTIKKEVQQDLSEEQKQLAKELQDELTIGRAMAAKLCGSFGLYEKSPTATQYINLVGNSLAQQSGRPELVYRFAILDTEDINAFAAPGGYIFVTKGLLKNINSESELASVLAHEIAHINMKHMYKDVMPKHEVSAGENLTRLLSRGGADIGASLGKAVSAGMKMLVEEGMSQDKEFEADAVSVIYTSASGYPAASLQSVLKRIKAQSSDSNLKKTHPPFDVRIEKISLAVKENALGDVAKVNEVILKSRFENFKKELL